MRSNAGIMSLKKGGLRWRTTYRYICGVCGAEQTVRHVDEFSSAGAQGVGINKLSRQGICVK